MLFKFSVNLAPLAKMGIASNQLAFRCLCVTLLHCTVWAFPEAGSDPDTNLDTPGIIKKYGFPVETHHATTDDGYILTLFRIPYGRHGTGALSKSGAGKPAVLLQHGLLCSSFGWVFNLPHESLPYILADLGYDVWLGNNRGNTYSLNHTKLTDKDSAFWDFTFDEMAKYDLPATVSKVLDANGHSSLSYIGHSQGTMVGFASFHKNSPLITKINLFVALAPVAYTYHMGVPLFQVLSKLHTGDQLVWLLGQGPFLPNDDDSWWHPILNEAAAMVCTPLDKFCNSLIELVGGKSNHLNITRMPVLMAHYPAGTSNKNINHFSQGLQKDAYQMYDYWWSSTNRKHYGQDTPPVYKLNEMAVPTALFSGSADLLANPADVAHLKQVVPSDTIVFAKEIDGYAHQDLFWGVDMNTFVFPDVVTLLSQYNPVRASVQI